MPPVRPHLSITLPRNFMFHYTDGQPPKTPEPQISAEATEPPEPPRQPPRQTYRLRRRRQGIPPYHELQMDSDVNDRHNTPIPTIETPDVSSGPSLPLPEPEILSEGFLAPTPTATRLMSPPRTPVAQISTSIERACQIRSEWAESQQQTEGEDISRPSSSCSGLSDSSLSSYGSMDSYLAPSESCTSPDTDPADPFVFPPLKGKQPMLSSPLQPYHEHPNKRLKMRKDSPWTEDMDHHLWITYMRYLQDPTVTPFKMLPGTAPPLGVCHRVAREAKKTWKGSRPSTDRFGNAMQSEETPRAGSPDTIKPAQSGSSTPTPNDLRKLLTKWPRSESATRKRLRELCKRKPSLSAHYQRLLRCRSPSPFTSSSPQSNSERLSESGQAASSFSSSAQDSGFSTRDMNISLTASTSATMQAGNPLSQLAAESSTPRARNDNWFGQPAARASAHQKSQSLQLGLGLGSSQHRSSSGPLGSPFNPISARPRLGARTGRSQPTTMRGLAPPLELHEPIPLPRSFKRRARFHLDDDMNPEHSEMRQSLLQEMFGTPAATSHRRVRSRGFSLGDMGQGARRLSDLFTPPPGDVQNTANPQINFDPLPTSPIGLAPPQVEPTRRLGSPFGGRSSNVHFHNTFPRNFSGHGFESSASFEERLGDSMQS